MKTWHLLLLVLLVLASGAWAGVTDYNVGNAERLADFYDGSKLWMATKYINGSNPNGRQFIINVVSALAKGGIVLAIGFFLMEAARIYLSGGSLQLHEALTFYGKTVVIVSILAIAVGSGTAFVDTLSLIFFAPIEAITSIIRTASKNAVMAEIANSLAAAAAANQDGKLSWFRKVMELDVSMLMTNFFMMFALVIAWVMSLWIGIMTAMVLALGPICIPFMLFQPVANVGWNWIKSMIAYPMMGAVGALVTGMLMTSGMLKFSVDAGALGQNLTSIASSVILIITMCSIPGVTSALFGGIVASPMAAARTLGGAASTAAAAGATMAGAAMAAGAPAATAAGQMGVRLVGAAEVGEDIRATAFRGASAGLAKFGEWAGPAGRAVLSTQFPGVQRFRRALAREQNLAAPFGSLAAQQSSMTDYVGRTYGADVAGTMSATFQADGFRAAGIQAKEGETKGASIARSADETLKSMGVRPNVASSLQAANRKVGAEGFDFDFNSRTANQGLMADWVQQKYGFQKARAFREAVSGTESDIAGRSKDVRGAVGAATMATAERLGFSFESATTAGKSDRSTMATASVPATPSKDWLAELSTWDTAKQQQNMTNFVKGRYGQDVADAFAQKLQEPQWADLTIDTSKAEGTTYDAVMSPFMYPLLESMGVKPATVTTMDDLQKKERGEGWNFSRNSREGNRDLMTDYVRQRAGEEEAQRFAAMLAADRDYLSGRQKHLAGAVGSAVASVYAEKGLTPPDHTARAQTADRGNYRGSDAIPEDLNRTAADYHKWNRDDQTAYMREIAATANNGQYKAFAYEVQIPDKWHPRPREGQSFPEATLGAMRELMRRQGFIGTNKKETP